MSEPQGIRVANEKQNRDLLKSFCHQLYARINFEPLEGISIKVLLVFFMKNTLKKPNLDAFHLW